MDENRIVISGPQRMQGELLVQGSKNAALPILAAAQLTKDNELEKDFLMKWIDVIDYQ